MRGAVVLVAAVLTSSLCRGQPQTTSTKAPDGQQEVPLVLSLEEVYAGKTVMANLASETTCSDCQGKGYVPGPTGAHWPCDKCNGRGKVATTTDVRIIIPRGAPEGGAALVPTAAGTIRVKFKSEPHKVFRRSGQFDLVHEASLTEDEAEGGFTRRIKLLSGSVLLLTRLGPSASVDFLPLAGLGMPKGPTDANGFGDLEITFALAASVTDPAIRQNFAMRRATLPRLRPVTGGVGQAAAAQLRFLGSLESSRLHAASGLVAAMRIRDEETSAKGWRVIDGTRCFGTNATIFTWEALLAPRSGVSGGVVSGGYDGTKTEPESYTVSGAMDANTEFNSYGFGSLNGVYTRTGWLCNHKPMYQKKNTASGGSGWVLFAGSDLKSWVISPGCNHPSQSMTGVPVADLNAALLATGCESGGHANSALCVWQEGKADASDWEPRPQLRLQSAGPQPQPLLLDGETLFTNSEELDAGTRGDGTAAPGTNDPSGGSGLGARLLLLRHVAGVGGLDEAWEVVGQSPAVAYSGEEARQMVVLDTPLVAQAGDCLGVGYEDGGVATLHFIPGENSRKESRVCQGPTGLSGSAGEVTYKRLEHRHCTAVSRQYLMQVGYQDLDGPVPAPPPPAQPERAEQTQSSELENQTMERAQEATGRTPRAQETSTSTDSQHQRDTCAESTHRVWLADGTNFPREVRDQETINLDKVKVGPTTFQLKTCFQLPESIWKATDTKVLGVQYSFGAPGVLQTAWENYCVACVQATPGNRAEVKSPALQINMLSLAVESPAQVWKTKLKVTLQGCPTPLVFTSDGVQIVP